MIKRQLGDVVVRVKFSELVRAPFRGSVKEAVNKYTVKCYNKVTGTVITFPFFDSVYDTQNKGIEHNELMDAILYCISADYGCTKERYPTFEDFCSEFGYDEDSRRDERTYKDVIALGDKLHSVFSEELINTFSDD